MLLRSPKPEDLVSKHSHVTAWNMFDLVNKYQYLCLQISLLCLSILLRFVTQKNHEDYERDLLALAGAHSRPGDKGRGAGGLLGRR